MPGGPASAPPSEEDPSPSSGGASASASASAASLSSLSETCRKLVRSVLPTIESHLGAEGYDHSRDSLDFLSAKNSLLLSYLVDLVRLVRLRLGEDDDDEGDVDGAAANQEEEEACLARLNEMRVALDRIRPMEKKMRYRIDRLLAAAGGGGGGCAGEFALSSALPAPGPAGGGGGDNDPLEFRPNPAAMVAKGEEEDEEGSDSSSDDGGDDDDEELRAARATLAGARRSKKTEAGRARGPSSDEELSSDDSDSDSDSDEESGDGGRNAGEDGAASAPGIYRPPRLSAALPPPSADTAAARAKEERVASRARSRLRRSELLRSLRDQFGDTPEEDDALGGAPSAAGAQRERSRRLAERERERIETEEARMMRTVVGRREKRERARMRREEESNLGAVADVGNLARGVSEAFGKADGCDESDEDDYEGASGGVGRFSDERLVVGGRGAGGNGEDLARYSNGKRRRVRDDDAEGGGAPRRGRRSRGGPKNELQRELYGGSGGGGGRGRKKRKSRR